MDVRRAGPGDAADLMPLVRAMHEHEGLPTQAWTERALRELLADPRQGFVLVAGGQAPVGYAVVGYGFSLEFAGRDAFVDELFVAPGSRAKGLGKILLAEIERLSALDGVKALHLEVDHANEHARRLYAANGYQGHPRHLMTKWIGKPS